MKIDKIIAGELKTFSKANFCKILFAVESGSRAWGFADKSSDYDIRFIYYYEPDRYLSLIPVKETVEFSIENRDYAGWELHKYAKLLLKSNPSALEWLTTDILYYGYKHNDFLSALEMFNPNALIKHYLSMSFSNYEKYIVDTTRPLLKKYFYVARGIINAKIVLDNKTIPPIDFKTAIDIVNIDCCVKEELKRLLKIKETGTEATKIFHNNQLDSFMNYYIYESKLFYGKRNDIKQKENEFFNTNINKAVVSIIKNG